MKQGVMLNGLGCVDAQNIRTFESSLPPPTRSGDNHNNRAFVLTHSNLFPIAIMTVRHI